MRFLSLIHLLEAVASLVHPEEITVLGSSALLAADATLGEPGGPLEFSYDADLLIRPIDQAVAEVLAEAIGEESLFANRNSYYAHILRPSIVETFPSGWNLRLEKVRGSSGARALNVYDVALIKLVLGREKDMDLLTALLARQVLIPETLREHYRAARLEDPQALKAGRNLHKLLA